MKTAAATLVGFGIMVRSPPRPPARRCRAQTPRLLAKLRQANSPPTRGGSGLQGFIGFFVKLIHIPINNIIVG